VAPSTIEMSKFLQLKYQASALRSEYETLLQKHQLAVAERDQLWDMVTRLSNDCQNLHIECRLAHEALAAYRMSGTPSPLPAAFQETALPVPGPADDENAGRRAQEPVDACQPAVQQLEEPSVGGAQSVGTPAVGGGPDVRSPATFTPRALSARAVDEPLAGSPPASSAWHVPCKVARGTLVVAAPIVRGKPAAARLARPPPPRRSARATFVSRHLPPATGRWVPLTCAEGQPPAPPQASLAPSAAVPARPWVPAVASGRFEPLRADEATDECERPTGSHAEQQSDSTAAQPSLARAGRRADDDAEAAVRPGDQETQRSLSPVALPLPGGEDQEEEERCRRGDDTEDDEATETDSDAGDRAQAPPADPAAPEEQGKKEEETVRGTSRTARRRRQRQKGQLKLLRQREPAAQPEAAERLTRECVESCLYLERRRSPGGLPPHSPDSSDEKSSRWAPFYNLVFSHSWLATALTRWVALVGKLCRISDRRHGREVEEEQGDAVRCASTAAPHPNREDLLWRSRRDHLARANALLSRVVSCGWAGMTIRRAKELSIRVVPQVDLPLLVSPWREPGEQLASLFAECLDLLQPHSLSTARRFGPHTQLACAGDSAGCGQCVTEDERLSETKGANKLVGAGRPALCALAPLPLFFFALCMRCTVRGFTRCLLSCSTRSAACLEKADCPGLCRPSTPAQHAT